MSVNKINNDGTLSPMAGTPALKLNGIQDNINKNGAKNLLPNRGTSYTAGNLTLTKNTDGSVTLNGTNNTGSTVWWKFAEDIVWGSEDESWEINGFPNEHTYNGYIFSLDGDSSVTIGTGLFYYGFTVANSTTWLGINTGASFSNLTVYPMVRLASDTDSTYQPYAMSNKELTERVYHTTTKTETFPANSIDHWFTIDSIANQKGIIVSASACYHSSYPAINNYLHSFMINTERYGRLGIRLSSAPSSSFTLVVRVVWTSESNQNN